jgi:hypothetical protein
MFEEELSELAIIDPPAIVGKYVGRPLLVAGSGKCLWEDMEPFIGKGWDYMAVNYAGLMFPLPLNHWSSQHTETATQLRELRQIDFKPVPHTEDYLFHAHIEGPKIDVVWNSHKLTGGTSAFSSTVYATLMGYNPIVLVGIPLDMSGHFYDAPFSHKDYGYISMGDQLKEVWQWGQDRIFKGKVRSMSGLTREICGEAI